MNIKFVIKDFGILSCTLGCGGGCGVAKLRCGVQCISAHLRWILAQIIMKHMERFKLNYLFKEIKIVKVIIKLSYDNKCKETVREI